MILDGSHGDEYVLTPSVGASVIDRECALDRHEAEHALRLALSRGRQALRLRRPEILALLDQRSSCHVSMFTDEVRHEQLFDHVTRTGRLLLIRDHEDAPSCGTDGHSHHAAERDADPKKPTHAKKATDAGPWGGNSARWPHEKKLESMHPQLRPLVQGVLKGMVARAFQPMIFYGWRSVKVQQEKVKEGHSHVKFSFHNATNKDGTPCAYAADIVDQRWLWKPEAAQNGYWVALGAEAKANNLYWGGTWKHPDWAHVQLLPNSQLKIIRRACGY
jgi:hypothetical protein